jgi:hypothetical protein
MEQQNFMQKVLSMCSIALFRLLNRRSEGCSGISLSVSRSGVPAAPLGLLNPKDDKTKILRNVGKVFTSRHGVIFQKTLIFSGTAMRTFNLLI